MLSQLLLDIDAQTTTGKGADALLLIAGRQGLEIGLEGAQVGLGRGPPVAQQDGPHSLIVVQHLVESHIHNVAPRLGVQFTHDAKIDIAQPPVVHQDQVGGVGIGLEKAAVQGLLKLVAYDLPRQAVAFYPVLG